MSAQKLADDMRATATEDVARMRETTAQETARARAGRAGSGAHRPRRGGPGRPDAAADDRRVEDVQREIDNLRLKRREAETSIEAIIASLHNTLDFVREQEERSHRVLALRPRLEATA